MERQRTPNLKKKRPSIIRGILAYLQLLKSFESGQHINFYFLSCDCGITIEEKCVFYQGYKTSDSYFELLKYKWSLNKSLKCM